MKMRNIAIIMLCITSVILGSCKKMVEVKGSATSIGSKDIYNNDATAIGAITSLYAGLSLGSITDPTEMSSLSCIAGLSADELTLFPNSSNAILSSFYRNALTKESGYSAGYWNTAYKRLYIVNEALNGLNGSANLTPTVKQNLVGEAKFMRAFYYFYLVNLYGDVPLILTTDYAVNALLPKSSKQIVYDQIIKDLEEAQSLLNDKYLRGDGISLYSDGSEERIRPNKWAAIAMLARVYLFRTEWSNAESWSTFVINNTALYGLEPLSKVFLKNNKEAIWQLQSTRIGYNTFDANGFILPASGPTFSFPVYLSETLINSFEAQDQRKEVWISNVKVKEVTYFHAYKYKVPFSNAANQPLKEYNNVMRLAEQFLIRAEARAHLGNLSGAILDLDMIRKRAGLPLIADIDPTIGKDDLLAAILKERQSEFFTEWGHRWFDLKRTEDIDEVMSVVTLKKGNNLGWKSHQQYYPITSTELNRNRNLTPTPGY